MSQPRSWKTSYRCINNCIDEEVKPFDPEIDQPVNIKLYFGDHRFNAYFRLEETSDEYRCRVRTLPHIYERMKIAREHLHPYFVSEAKAIIDALGNGHSYVPGLIAPAPGLPLGREYDQGTPGHRDSWTTWSPSEQTTNIRIPKRSESLPWRAAANAFLYAVTLLNAATERTVVDHFEKHPRSRPYWQPAGQELPENSSTA